MSFKSKFNRNLFHLGKLIRYNVNILTLNIYFMYLFFRSICWYLHLCDDTSVSFHWWTVIDRTCICIIEFLLFFKHIYWFYYLSGITYILEILSLFTTCGKINENKKNDPSWLFVCFCKLGHLNQRFKWIYITVSFSDKLSFIITELTARL